MKREVRVMTVLVLVSVSVASALMLAGINLVSSDVIKKNQERQLKVAVLKALSLSFDSDRPEEAFMERIEVRSLPNGDLYLDTEDGVIIGAAFGLKGPGFWGPVSIVIGIDPSDFRIKGLEILEQQETPGLGARIEEDGFRNQFREKILDSAIVVQIKGNRPGPNDVSAITGATISSKALEKIISEGSGRFIEAVKSLRKG